MPTKEEVYQVKKYIEFCMMHDMTKTETIDCIATKCNIHPILTEAVWERLEEENEEFMKTYYTRLALIDQIIRFNKTLFKQAEMMRGNIDGYEQARMHPHANHSNGSEQAAMLPLANQSNGSEQAAMLPLANQPNGSEQTAMLPLANQPNGSEQTAMLPLANQSNYVEQELMHPHVQQSNGFVQAGKRRNVRRSNGS